jgi:thioredoxin reductase
MEANGMPSYDLIVVGAGIAGMTAAVAAVKEGIKKILIIEKEAFVGGIINQCIHNGFGEEFLDEPVTGPEYINFVEKQLDMSCIEVKLNTTLLDVTGEKVVTYVNSKEGVKDATFGAIIFAMGSRERYSGSIVIPTNGLTGVFTVGEAHRIITLDGYLPGRKTIIIAKDKWGFIVARRLIIEGGIVEGVIIEKKFEEIADSETCDSLFLSVGFIPENTIPKKLKMDLDSDILGPKVVDFQTSIDGFFACGNIIYGENALHMKETHGIECGIKTAEYIKKYIY